MALLKQEQNCWRVSHAARSACLIDGENYFTVLRQAMMEAEHTIYILGWDINSRFKLVRDNVEDDLPAELRGFLSALADKSPDLNIYILSWDYSPLLALDREWMAEYKLKHNTHKRVHFEMARTHIPTASHHQKVVVIDDGLAFSGGLDLTFGRWDTSAHGVDDKRRCDDDEDEIPRPYHDVQMMVDGDCAKSLGDLFRQRWQMATNQDLTPPKARSVWLQSVTPDFDDCTVAISLTQPASQQQKEMRHVEQLYLYMINTAENYIYIENQYLTADKIGSALKRSLCEPNGPEIVIVTPLNTNGWLSQYTMDVLRCRMVDELREADEFDRLRIFYPRLPGADEDSALNVHAKVMVVDDAMVRIGSSNLNNRSMGLDTECDLLVLTETDQNRKSARRFLYRLLGEHLDVNEHELDDRWQQHDSLLRVIESCQGSERTLTTLQSYIPEEVDRNLPDKALIDPEAAVNSERLREILVPDEARGPAASRIFIGGLILLLILALFAVWRWTPLADMVEVNRLTAFIEQLQQSHLGSLIAIAFIMIGGLIAIPITVLIVATMLVFGSMEGAVLGLTGSVLSAVLAYIAGQFLGRDFIRKLAGKKLNHISEQLGKRGIMTIIIVRLIPVAPFVVVNLVAGASHIRLRDFVIGSFIGLIPGTTALALLTDGVIRAASEPSAYHLFLVSLVLVAIAITTLVLRHWLLKFKKN